MVELASNTTHARESVNTAYANLMQESTGAATESRTRQRWWIDYELQGDLKFISHHDTLRLFRRALARADLPVRFSEGFNPHPKITIPLPRPVGMSSAAEAIVVDMREVITEATILQALTPHMPKGLTIRGARCLNPGERPQPDAATYRYRPERALPHDMAERMARLLEALKLNVERKDPKTKRLRSIDIRPYLLDIQLVDADVVITLRVTGAGTAKPSELIELLLPDSGPQNHRIHRESVRWR